MELVHFGPSNCIYQLVREYIQFKGPECCALTQMSNERGNKVSVSRVKCADCSEATGVHGSTQLVTKGHAHFVVVLVQPNLIRHLGRSAYSCSQWYIEV